MSIIGERIRARRQELHLTQRQLAERLGYLDHTTLTRVEAGKIDLPQSRLEQFAEVLGVTPSHLMGWDAAEPEELGGLAAAVLKDPVLLQLVQDYRALDPAGQTAVSTLASALLKVKKE